MLRAYGNSEEARLRCNQALRISRMFGEQYCHRLRPQLAECYTELCECLGELGRVEEALEAADAAAMLSRCRHYIERSLDLEVEPDVELIRATMEELQQLDDQDAGS
jgi:hypothetical protein